jgi:hypothetical protein
MGSDRYIVTNIAYGTGPYLRITELAMAINEGLSNRGNDRARIVLPLIYGQTQKRVLEEEFGGGAGGLPDALLLDETLGDLCRRTFYGEEPFEVSIGDRIAQLVVQRYTDATLMVVSELGRTHRDVRGFGSTGD